MGACSQSDAVDEFGGLVVYDSAVVKSDIGTDSDAGEIGRVPVVDVKIDAVGAFGGQIGVSIGSEGRVIYIGYRLEVGKFGFGDGVGIP